MTTLQDVREILAGSEPSAWIPFPETGVWTFSEDVQLRIQRDERVERSFTTAWTRGIQGDNETYGYLVYYGSSPVEYHTIASVDNFRAHVPLPQQPAGPNGSYTITPYQATLGRIITGNPTTFESYLETTGIRVRQPE